MAVLEAAFDPDHCDRAFAGTLALEFSLTAALTDTPDVVYLVVGPKHTVSCLVVGCGDDCPGWRELCGMPIVVDEILLVVVLKSLLLLL